MNGIISSAKNEIVSSVAAIVAAIIKSHFMLI